LGAAFQSVRPGGDVVAIGLTHIANTITIDIFSLLLQKRLTGTYAGSITPRVDIPAAVDLFMDGRLPLDKLISSQYKLDELPQAYEDLEAGRIGRGVVVF
jgi:Zn-dependent alcohol dehydrogenase